MLVIHTREGHAPDLSDLPANKRWRSARIGAEIGSAGPCGRILVRGEPGWEIVPEVAPIAGEVHASTSRARAPSTPPTSTWCCAPTASRTSILTGITTDVCVHTTMREANDRGYECLILSDCTGATDPGNHDAALHMVTMQGGVFGCVADLRRPSSRATTWRRLDDRSRRRRDPYPFTFDPATHRAGGHRHAARLRRARRLRRDASATTSSLLQRGRRRRCRRCSAAARAAGLTVIHTREGHLPDLSDCPPAKLDRGAPTHAHRRPGPEGPDPDPRRVRPRHHRRAGARCPASR